MKGGGSGRREDRGEGNEGGDRERDEGLRGEGAGGPKQSIGVDGKRTR